MIYFASFQRWNAGQVDVWKVEEGNVCKKITLVLIRMVKVFYLDFGFVNQDVTAWKIIARRLDLETAFSVFKAQKLVIEGKWKILHKI